MNDLPCIKCGGAQPLISGLCKDCFRETTDPCVFPKIVKATVCSTCGAYASRSKWHRADSLEDALEARIIEATNVHKGIRRPSFTFGYDFRDPGITMVKVRFTAALEGVELTEEGTVTVKIKQGVCDACSRRSGSYFEAIIQLRATDRKIDEDEKKRAEDLIQSMVTRAAEKDDGAFITKAEEVRGGYDYFLSQQSLGERIARELTAIFGASHKRSPSLAGRKDGRDLYRITHMIRLPRYRTGDFVPLPENVSGSAHSEDTPPWMIVSITGHHVHLRQLGTGGDRKFNRTELESVTLAARREDVQSAVVVSEDGELIQVMHPTNFRTVDVNRPAYDFEVVDGSARVLVMEDAIYLLFP